MAGKAAERDNITTYNCAYHAIDNVEAFAEDLYISMCGTGIGYSVESFYISKLPWHRAVFAIGFRMDRPDNQFFADAGFT